MTQPIFVFAPGAGAPSTSAWMQRYGALLGSLGPVHAFDYLYTKEGRRAPDRLPKLVAAHSAAIADARCRLQNHRGQQKIVLVGKSMGGRVGCHASLTLPVSGLICLGYPLQGSGKKKPLRDAVLKELTTPLLFVQGTRDPMCPLELLDSVRPQMKAPSELHVVESGNHSLEATKTWLKQNQRSQDDVEAAILHQISIFCASL